MSNSDTTKTSLFANAACCILLYTLHTKSSIMRVLAAIMAFAALALVRAAEAQRHQLPPALRQTHAPSQTAANPIEAVAKNVEGEPAVNALRSRRLNALSCGKSSVSA